MYAHICNTSSTPSHMEFGTLCPFSSHMHTSTPSQNSCAGLIAGVANEVCGVGVAYKAQVSGIRLLDRKMTDILEAKSFVHKAHTNWIYSCRCVCVTKHIHMYRCSDFNSGVCSLTHMQLGPKRKWNSC